MNALALNAGSGSLRYKLFARREGDGRATESLLGSGPNGLAAAGNLARGKLAVLVVEASDTLGGDTPHAAGFIHDICSSRPPAGLTLLPVASVGQT